jgi:hypothetical protein
MKILDYCKDGKPIIYDEMTGDVIYKEHRVSFSLLKKAYDSNVDRVKLTEKLSMSRSDYFISFGCLQLTNQQCKSFIKTICNKSN